jgi:hypothetical protein
MTQAADGRCKALDARADGYVRAEVCAFFSVALLPSAHRTCTYPNLSLSWRPFDPAVNALGFCLAGGRAHRSEYSTAFTAENT